MIGGGPRSGALGRAPHATLVQSSPTAEAPSPPAEAPSPPTRPPRLSGGAELLGEYEDSGFREPRYLVRRADGQIVQLSQLLYLVASSLDTGGDLDQISRDVSERLGRDVSADNVAYLIDRKLRPTGIVATSEPGGAASGVATRANPLLSLRLRLPLVPERVHGRVTTALGPLFRTPVWIAVVGTVLAIDAWLVLAGRDSVAAAMREVIYGPRILLAVTALTVVLGAFHETGHATAARYGGATPGAMGAGIYLVWPVFYTDVTDAYRLDRRGRLRTDLGGIYFNLVFSLLSVGLYGATGARLFLAMVLVAQIEALRQLLPFVRLDGYYIVADLAGVPNLFSYLRPALGSAVRFRQGVPRHTPRTRMLRALTRRSQTVLTIWAGVTFPILVANLVAFVVLAPRIAGTAWGSSRLQGRLLDVAIEQGDLVTVLNALVGLVMLALPAAGVVYLVARVGGKVPALIGTAWRRNPRATGAVVTVAGLVLTFQLALVWPDTFRRFAAVGDPARVEAVESVVRETRARGGEDPDRPATAEPAVPVPAPAAPSPDAGAPGTPGDGDTTVPSSTTAPAPDTSAPGPATTAPPSSSSPSSPSTTAPAPTTTAPTTTTTETPGITVLPGITLPPPPTRP